MLIKVVVEIYKVNIIKFFRVNIEIDSDNVISLISHKT